MTSLKPVLTLLMESAGKYLGFSLFSSLDSPVVLT